jgi:hypothetical protein
MAAVTAVAPTLSQIEAWSTDHLETAAAHWTETAETWEHAFTTVHREAPSPGGTVWEGAAADAAVLRTGTDRVVVAGTADSLHAAAKAARFGADEIAGARQLALQTINEARAAGFTVGEGLTVTSQPAGPPALQAARQVQAQAFAAAIRASAENLVAVDNEVAGNVTTAVSEVSGAQFGDTPISPPREPKKPTIQAVDNRTVKDAPPQPVPPDPQPGPMPPINNAGDVRNVLDPLQTGGKRGPNGVGTRPDVKEMWDSSSMKRLWDYLTRNAADTTPRSGYDGIARVLPDGTEIGLRQSGKGWGDTIDVWYPDGTDKKIHTPYSPYFPPLISSPPQLPPVADPAPAPLPPPQVGHAPVTLPPSGVFDPNGVPPWLQNPSPPGFQVQPTQPPTIMPGVELPSLPTPAPPASPPDGSSVLGEIGHDLAEAGKKTGEGVVAGIVILGGIAASIFTPSGQIAR